MHPYSDIVSSEVRETEEIEVIGSKCHMSCSGGCGCVFIHSGEEGGQGSVYASVTTLTIALAQILDRILPDKILVPAKQANVRIRLRSRNSTI